MTHRGAQPGVELVIAGHLTALVTELAAVLRASSGDPFRQDLVIVPDAGTGRITAQLLARELGTSSSDDGVCAGVRFISLAALKAELLAAGSGTSPLEAGWDMSVLPWHVLELLDAHRSEPWAQSLAVHLPAATESALAPGRRIAQAQSIAAVLDEAIAERPDVLRAWSRGEDQQAVAMWQPMLWRALIARTGVDPIACWDQVCTWLREQPVPHFPGQIALLAPAHCDDITLALLRSLSCHHAVTIYHISAAERGLEPALPAALGQAGAIEQQRLASLNPHIRVLPTERTWVPQVTEHICHGPDRQVEVLRDALTAAFADDPTLEPRDVVIHCADLPTFQPLLTAAFSPAISSHPAAGLRVQISDASIGMTNHVLAALIAMLRLASSRASIVDFAELCSQTPLRRRWRFTEDDLARMQQLFVSANARWGRTVSHRQSWGLGAIGQNTWQAALDRMIAGIALDEEILAPLGTAIPLPDVSSQDVDLLGRIAEIMARIAGLAQSAQQPQPLAQWYQLCRSCIDDAMESSPDDAWQYDHAYEVLAALAYAGAQPLLALGDVLGLLEQSVTTRPARSVVGTGSAIVCSASAHVHIPRKLTCLLGYDDGVFPHQRRDSAESLTRVVPRPDDPTTTAHQRQALLHSATASDRVIVVRQGMNAHSNSATPTAPALAEFLNAAQAAGEVTRYVHPLQPYSPRNFTGEDVPRSFDGAAAAAAAAARLPRSSAPNLFSPVMLPEQPREQHVTLAELSKNLANPLRAFQRAVGISDYEPNPLSDAIAVELDGLERWAIGDRLLRLCQRGYSLEHAVYSERLRGALPPGELGRRVVDSIAGDVERIMEKAQVWGSASQEQHSIALAVDGIRLTGAVSTRKNEIGFLHYSRISAKHQLEAWVALLALHCTEPGEWQCRIIGRDSQCVLGPLPRTANTTTKLAELLRITSFARRTPLPLPISLAREYARAQLHGSPVRMSTLSQLWKRESPSLQQFYPDLSDIFATPPVEELSLPYQEPHLFGSLACTIWLPLLSMETNLR